HGPNRTFTASSTEPTPCTSSASPETPERLLWGTTAAAKPRAAASLSRASSPVTARTSPASPTSPITTRSPRTRPSRQLEGAAHPRQPPPHRPVQVARGRREPQPQVRRGLRGPRAAGDIDEGVLGLQGEACPLPQYPYQRSYPIGVMA